MQRDGQESTRTTGERFLRSPEGAAVLTRTARPFTPGGGLKAPCLRALKSRI